MQQPLQRLPVANPANTAMWAGEALRHNECVLDAESEAALSERHIFLTEPSPSQRTTIAFILDRETYTKHTMLGGIIASALGQGKTYSMIAAMVLRDKLKTSFLEGHNGKTLVVAPASVIYTWKSEIEKHLAPGTLRYFLYHGSKRREQFMNEHENVEVIITSYGSLRADYNNETDTFHTLSAMNHVKYGRYKRIVLDEAHHIRNSKAQVSRAARKLHSTIKWCITGTPMWNALSDLWPVINFLGAWPLADRVSWTLETAAQNDMEMSEMVLPKIRNFITPIMIRRDKSELDLPPKEELAVMINLSDRERLFYESLFANSQAKMLHLLQMEDWLKNTKWAKALRQRLKMTMMSIFTRMRQACVHPQIVIDAFERIFVNNPIEIPLGGNVMDMMIDGAIERIRQEDVSHECIVCMSKPQDHCAIPCGHAMCGDCFAIIDSLRRETEQLKCPVCRTSVAAYRPIHEVLNNEQPQMEAETDSTMCEWMQPGTKIEWMVHDICKRREEDPKVKFIIFSQWVRSLDVTERFLKEHGFHMARMDGSMSVPKRFEVQKRFCTEEMDDVLLVSLMCGSEGLNLQRASVVYFLDPWWTAARNEQAGDRVHRMGQMRDVTIVHLIARNTLEERVFDIQSNKRGLVGQIFSLEDKLRVVFDLDEHQ